jgi:hypothetical protein
MASPSSLSGDNQEVSIYKHRYDEINGRHVIKEAPKALA